METTFVAFDSFTLIAAGELPAVAATVKNHLDQKPDSSILIFDSESSRIVDVDFRGSVDQVLDRLARLERQSGATANLIGSLKSEQVGPGRPKLGVVAREVTLLPRHWDWLNRQPGGASVALRKLVEDARRTSGGKDRIRESRESAYKFMSAIAGDLPGFEEALRAVFAGRAEAFQSTISTWPTDIREHASKLSAGAFQPV